MVISGLDISAADAIKLRQERHSEFGHAKPAMRPRRVVHVRLQQGGHSSRTQVDRSCATGGTPVHPQQTDLVAEPADSKLGRESRGARQRDVHWAPPVAVFRQTSQDAMVEDDHSQRKQEGCADQEHDLYSEGVLAVSERLIALTQV